MPCQYNNNILTLVRLLDLVKFFSAILPEIEFPDEKISLDEKVIFTIGSGLLFFLSQLPIYGLVKDATLKMADPYPALRPLFALEQGSLLELGLLPIITSAFVWQIAAGLKLINVNFNYAQDRELFQTAQKLTALVLASVFAVALLASGYYIPVLANYSGESVPYGSYALIFTQIVGWNFILNLIAEVIDKGYGFGSGPLCFIAVNAATQLVRDVVGVEAVTAVPDGVPETYGVVTYFIRALFSMELKNIKDAAIGIFARANFPNLPLVLILIATGLATIALQNVRVELPIRSNKARGTANVYPIRLLYTGALPVLFAFTVLANIQLSLHFASIALQPFYPVISKILESRSDAGSVVSGLSFYVSAPASLSESVLSPIRAVVFSSSVLVLATTFAHFWANISGSAPKDIARQFKDQSIIIAGKRDVSITKELSKIVPVAAVTGAFSLAVVALAGELLGSSGNAAAVTVGICAAFAILEDFMMDFQQSGGNSQLMNSLGGFQ